VGVKTITPATALPSVTDQVTVDGYSQSGASLNSLANGDNAVLLIQLDGSVAEIGGNLLAGLTIAADDCVLRGLVINGFFNQILISSGSGISIAGNFLNTDPAATTVQVLSPGVIAA
jgi:hypothetical protein